MVRIGKKLTTVMFDGEAPRQYTQAEVDRIKQEASTGAFKEAKKKFKADADAEAVNTELETLRAEKLARTKADFHSNTVTKLSTDKILATGLKKGGVSRFAKEFGEEMKDLDEAGMIKFITEKAKDKDNAILFTPRADINPGQALNDAEAGARLGDKNKKQTPQKRYPGSSIKMQG